LENFQHLTHILVGVPLTTRSNMAKFCPWDRQNIPQHPDSPDHLCPPDSLLELHQPLFVLIALHQNPGHFHTGEAAALSYGNVVLQGGGALLQPTKDGRGLMLVQGKSGDRKTCLLVLLLFCLVTAVW